MQELARFKLTEEIDVGHAGRDGDDLLALSFQNKWGEEVEEMEVSNHVDVE